MLRPCPARSFQTRKGFAGLGSSSRTLARAANQCDMFTKKKRAFSSPNPAAISSPCNENSTILLSSPLRKLLGHNLRTKLRDALAEGIAGGGSRLHSNSRRRPGAGVGAGVTSSGGNAFHTALENKRGPARARARTRTIILGSTSGCTLALGVVNQRWHEDVNRRASSVGQGLFGGCGLACSVFASERCLRASLGG